MAAAIFPDVDYVTLAGAAKLIPGRPHVSTVMRWTRGGVNGRVLPTLKVGGKRLIAVDALRAFIEGQNPTMTPATTRTPRQRQRAVTAAKASLKKAGV